MTNTTQPWINDPNGYTAFVLHITKPVTVFWCSVGMFYLILSSFKLDKKKLLGYGGLFWITIMISYAIMIITRIISFYEQDLNVTVNKLLMTTSSTLAEFSFSVVILAFKSLHNMFLLKSKKAEKWWVIFNAFQVPINVAIVGIQI
eukprot:Pgem_evm1s9476